MGMRMGDEEFESIAWQGCERDPTWAHLANEARRARESEDNLWSALRLARLELQFVIEGTVKRHEIENTLAVATEALREAGGE